MAYPFAACKSSTIQFILQVRVIFGPDESEHDGRNEEGREQGREEHNERGVEGDNAVPAARMVSTVGVA